LSSWLCRQWGDRVLTYAQVHEWMALGNLVVLAGVLSLLIGLSFFLQKRGRFVWHGDVMLVVVMIAGLLTVAHMGPSLLGLAEDSLRGLGVVTVTGMVHGVVGLVALSLGVWFVSAWAFVQSGETSFCAPKKKLMRRIIALWVVALVLGLIYYPLHLALG
jgi:hypothetical protein